MNTQHTLGPWSVTRHGTIVGGKVFEFHRGSAQKQIAMACVMDEGNGEQAANARLIAAAPDLLELLTTMPHPEYRTGITHMTDEWYEWDSKRRAAIAEATGETK